MKTQDNGNDPTFDDLVALARCTVYLLANSVMAELERLLFRDDIKPSPDAITYTFGGGVSVEPDLARQIADAIELEEEA